MVTKKLWIISLILISTSSWAANITGKVIDAQSRQALDFVNVIVTPTASTTPIAGEATDADGVFVIMNIPNGTYEVNIQFMGYVPLKRAVTIKGNNVDLGKLLLKEDTKTLEEVEVVAQGSTMRFELDKKIFTVDQNMAAAGASVSEVLENIPTVDVDQEGNISMRNSEAVEVWINGKPAGLTAENRGQVLAQMPADGIKEIELITNPGAKFSPEGTAGIINIVTKKNRQAGYYGSLSAGIDYSMAEPWNIPPGANAGFNINFNKGICDAYFNIGYRFRSNNGGTDINRYNLSGEGQERLEDIPTSLFQSHMVEDGHTNRQNHGLFLRAGVNLQVSEHSSIGISGFGMPGDSNAFRGQNNDTRSYLITNCPAAGEALDTIRMYERNSGGAGWHPGGSGTLDYTLDYGQHKLMVSGSYRYFGFNQDFTYTTVEKGKDDLIQEQLNNNRDQVVEIKADYEWKPTKNSRLEAGYQSTLAWRETQAKAYNDHAQATELYAYFNDFHNNEQNHALYISYGNRFWDKFSVQVGLRGEYFMRHLDSKYKDATGTERDAYENKREKQDTAYFQLYPSAYLSYDFGHGHELQLNYTRRVDRPRGHQLNPRIDFADSTNIRIGNPNLLPSYSSSLELNYLKTWNRHTLSAGVFWRFQDGVVQNVRYMEDDIMKNTFINVARRQDLGIEVVAKNKLFGEVLQLTTSANFYWNTITAAHYEDYVNGEFITVDLPAQNILAWSARINAQFMFTKTFSGQISGRYRSPRVVAQGTTTHSYSIDLGLRKTFLDRKLALALNVRDILDSRARRNTTWGDGFWQKQENRWHSRTVSLTLTWNFGTQQKKNKSNDMNRNNSDMGSGYDDFGED